MKKHKVLTICGSMRNYNQMLAAANTMTKEGWLVFMPFVLKVDDPGMDNELQEIHKSKIDLSDAILVIGNPGDSTKEEIAYAKNLGIEIRYDQMISAARNME